jgi:hypothetical protein
MIIRDADSAALRQFYGYVPRCRAWVAEEDGRIVAVAGYKVQNGAVRVFADLNDEIRRHPVKMVRCGRKLMAEARAKHMPVYVEVDKYVPRSREFLEHLGFREWQTHQ